ncbi:MAG: Fe-S cluster assembly protein SufD, partial [Scytonema sp. CRU_2_7]|nr:Fe-S cluster assembly protein SufD [Scytonema sp. CRU_2_7]
MTIQVSMVPDVAETNAQVKVDRQAYLQSLLHQRAPFPSLDGEPSQVWLPVIRDRATEQVTELAIPSTREEEWRFTDLADLLQTQFVPAPPHSVELADLAAWILPEASESRLVFVDGGVLHQTLSAIAGLPAGTIVSNLPPALEQPLQNYLAKL